MSIDTIFKQATIIDGSGQHPFVADVAIDGHNIVEIGTINRASRNEIDARNLVLAPGFIDVHTHDDFALTKQPTMSFKTLQGVTTVVTGNCGTSAVPISDWMSKVESAEPAVNVVSLIGHGSIRERVIGRTENREATNAELKTMVDLVEEALDAGSAGISTGLVYVPGAFSSLEEVIALTQPVANRGGIYTTHLRNEADKLIESLDEAFEIGHQTGVRIQISHLKAIGAENFDKLPLAIDKIRNAHSLGLDVMADQYPYSRGSTSLDQLVARGAFDGPSPFGFVQGEDVLIASAPRTPQFEGLTLDVIAQSLGLSTSDSARFLVDKQPEGCFIVYQNQSDANIERVMREDFVMIGSDGVPTGTRPHPRLHHTFPRVLGEYSRNRSTIPLQTAIHKMTGMCADRFKIPGRGVIAEGNFADLVLFDPQTVIDTGDYADPTRVPDGILGTWVNGECVTRNGQPTGSRTGDVIRMGHA